MPRITPRKTSKRFRDLKKNIDLLNDHLLPKAKISGNYSLREQTLLRSHRLLLHAEIESYFEGIAEDTAQRAIKNYHTSRKARHVLAAICAFSQSKINLPKRFDDPSPEKFLYKRMDDELSQFMQTIKSNNGIIQKDLCKLLLPLGVDEKALDPVFLTDLDDFGRKRGELAHNSIKINQQIDPKDVLKKINTLWLPEIQKIDEIIMELK